MRILKNERVLFQGGRTGHREECRRASEIRPSWLEVLLPDVIKFTYHHQRVDFVLSAAVLVSSCRGHRAMKTFKCLFFLRFIGPFGTQILSLIKQVSNLLNCTLKIIYLSCAPNAGLTRAQQPLDTRWYRAPHAPNGGHTYVQYASETRSKRV